MRRELGNTIGRHCWKAPDGWYGLVKQRVRRLRGPSGSTAAASSRATATPTAGGVLRCAPEDDDGAQDYLNIWSFRGLWLRCSEFRVQPSRRPKKRPVKSKKKLMKFHMKKRISKEGILPICIN